MSGTTQARVGILWPLGTPEGQELQQGASLAAELLRSTRLELVFADHQGSRQGALELARRMVKDEKVVGFLGCYDSSVTVAVATWTENKGIPLIIPDSLEPLEFQRPPRYIFRIPPNEWKAIRDTLVFVKVVGRMDFGSHLRVGYVVREELPGWPTLLKVASRLSVGLTILPLSKHPQDVELEKAAADMVRWQPHCLISSVRAETTVRFLQVLAECYPGKISYGIGIFDMFGLHAQNVAAILQDVCSHIFFATLYTPEGLQGKSWLEWAQRLYKERTGRGFSVLSALAFTGVQVWATIFGAATSIKPEQLAIVARRITVPGHELAFPWRALKFSSQGENLGSRALATQLVGEKLMLFTTHYFQNGRRKIE